MPNDANTYVQTNAQVGPSFSLSRRNLHRIIFIRSGLCYFSKPSSLQHLLIWKSIFAYAWLTFLLLELALLLILYFHASKPCFMKSYFNMDEEARFPTFILTLRLMQYAVSRYEKKVLYQWCCMSHICTLPSTPPGSPLAPPPKKNERYKYSLVQ